MSVRRAGREDIARIAALEAQLFADAWSEAELRRCLAEKTYRIYVAEIVPECGSLYCDTGCGQPLQTAGYLIGRSLSGEAELYRVGCEPASRRRGVGRALLERFLEEMTAEGNDAVFLEVREGNGAAIALYQSAGFVQTGRRRDYYRDPKEDALLMTREAHGAQDAGPAREANDARDASPAREGGQETI